MLHKNITEYHGGQELLNKYKHTDDPDYCIIHTIWDTDLMDSEILDETRSVLDQIEVFGIHLHNITTTRTDRKTKIKICYKRLSHEDS